MATHKQLIPILAEAFGIPFATAQVIDRGLANAGLRKKHKGPKPPDMTREEAVVFMLGCALAYEQPTKVAAIIAPWIEKETRIGPAVCPGYSFKLDRYEDQDAPDYGQVAKISCREGENMKLVPYLLVMMSDLYSTWDDQIGADLRINTTWRKATFTIHSGGQCPFHETEFALGSDLDDHDDWGVIERQAVIHWRTFHEIAKRTDDPHAENYDCEGEASD